MNRSDAMRTHHHQSRILLDDSKKFSVVRPELFTRTTLQFREIMKPNAFLIARLIKLCRSRSTTCSFQPTNRGLESHNMIRMKYGVIPRDSERPHIVGVQSLKIYPESDSDAGVSSSMNLYTNKHVEVSGTAQEYLNRIIDQNEPLLIFGYGSLCWRPGDGILSNPLVQKEFGRALGYKRCWAQKSEDHRGNESFPGLVCTLLRDDEVEGIMKEHDAMFEYDCKSATEGLVYKIPKELVRACLDELNFREKGGYSIDIIDVIVNNDDDDDSFHCDETKSSIAKVKTVKAILYRGTPTNEMFSNRALLDEVYAAAVMATAIGPSGRNDVYLSQLDSFLANAIETGAEDLGNYSGDNLTSRLTSFSKMMQAHQLYFLYGSGSNQYDQLLLHSSFKDFNNAARLVRGDEAHDMKEIVLMVPKGEEHFNLPKSQHRIKKLFSGGSYSALLTHYGNLYLWGCNREQQLGRSDNGNVLSFTSHPVVPPLDIKVETAALGHGHTLIIEKGTGTLYAFGDDKRGQVSGMNTKETKAEQFFKLDFGKFVEISAGVFHSAGITDKGELVSFGCKRYGQSFGSIDDGISAVKWKPDDGSRLIKVACGYRHTVVLDEHGRVYAMGDHKYGQLGRKSTQKICKKMKLVDGFLGQKGSGCVDIDCGWSHSIALVKCQHRDNHFKVFGWGRNDKNQIASASNKKDSTVDIPCGIDGHLVKFGVKGAFCGAESIHILNHNDEIASCGWNEHGNLGVGHAKDVDDLFKVKGARIYSSDLNECDGETTTLMAAGGAHFLAAKTIL